MYVMDPTTTSVCDCVCDYVCYETLEDQLELAIPPQEWFTPDSPPFDFDQAMEIALSGSTPSQN